MFLDALRFAGAEARFARNSNRLREMRQLNYHRAHGKFYFE